MVAIRATDMPNNSCIPRRFGDVIGSGSMTSMKKMVVGSRRILGANKTMKKKNDAIIRQRRIRFIDIHAGVSKTRKKKTDPKESGKSCCQETAHQETRWLKISATIKTPSAAGLKMCLSKILIKFFDATASMHAIITPYQGSEGAVRSAIIRPVTIAALGKKNCFFRNFRKTKSARIALNTAITRVNMAANEGVRKIAVR